MIARIELWGEEWEIDLQKGIDLSQPIAHQADGPRCFGAEPPSFEPMKGEGWVARVREGGSVNADDVKFNPHGNGTHTECFGHISQESQSVQKWHKDIFVPAFLSSARLQPGQKAIGKDNLDLPINFSEGSALIIRTYPNEWEDKHRNFTNTEPPFLSVDLIEACVEKGWKHLLIDLPSVDPEKDEGKVSGHKAWWNWPTYEGRREATITELIYVPKTMADGWYVLNMQRAAFELDCAPSRPILFDITKI